MEITKDNFINEFIEFDNKKLIHDNYFKITEAQAKSILENKLSRLTSLERTKLSNDLKECVKIN